MMKYKKMMAGVLVAALTAASFGGVTAFAEDTTSDITLSATVNSSTVKYKLSIPSGKRTIDSAKDKYNEVGTLSVTKFDGETVGFSNTKQVSVTVSYSGSLTNTDTSVTAKNKLAYKLVEGTENSNTDLESGRTYSFSANDINGDSGKSVAIGAVVTGDPAQVENGTYEDKVTFTASVEEAKQLHSFTLTGPYTGETLVVEYYEGDTWNDMVAKYPDTLKVYSGYVEFGGDGFIYPKNGRMISATAQIDPNETYEVG